jgi:hypothetical protein
MHWLENVWEILGMTAVIALAVLVVNVVLAERKVQHYYYLQNGASRCVMASVTWDTDHYAFCDIDAEKVQAFLKSANESLKK